MSGVLEPEVRNLAVELAELDDLLKAVAAPLDDDTLLSGHRARDRGVARGARVLACGFHGERMIMRPSSTVTSRSTIQSPKRVFVVSRSAFGVSLLKIAL